MPTPLQIGVTADFQVAVPGRIEPVLAEVFDPLPNIRYRYFEATGQDEKGKYVTPQDIADFDAVLALAYRFPAATFHQSQRLAVLARWGVGYDTIDIPACTAADVLLAITVDAVRRPVGEAIVTLLHALSMRLVQKDRLVREGKWNARALEPSVGLRGKTLASVGLGNIGSEMFRLLEPFGLKRKLAHDPYASPKVVAELGIELVDLPTLFAEADFVTVNCPLTTETRGMVNASLISRMKPTAYLVNTARGPIVNQADLIAALQAKQIAGAGLDVFEVEPLPLDSPLIQMDNVILAPHALAWNDELYHDNGYDACQSILSVFRGELPPYIVNRSVVEQDGFKAKVAALKN
ncbi:MAG: NAD(P)-dependent oxidoreductase [Caldilineaceae bacterium]